MFTIQKQRIAFEVVAFDLTTDTSSEVLRTAVRQAKMVSRVLRLAQDSMRENSMLRTRIIRVTISLEMFNLLQELDEERNSFLLLMMLRRWNGRDIARMPRGTEALMIFQSQSSTSTGPSFHREELWQ